MALFILETDTVSSAADTINSLASKVDDLSSSVSSYDTSCEDGFDFASAKGVIASNLEACATKIRNTGTVLTTVVDSHTQLQNSLKFDASTGSVESASSSTSDANSISDSSAVNNVSSGYSGGNAASTAAVAAGATGASTVVHDDEKITKDINETPIIDKVKYSYVDISKLSPESLKLFKSKNFKYDNKYAKYNGYNVISCDSSIGKVGDVVRFKSEDGTNEDFVIGVVTKGEKNKNSISLIVENDKDHPVVADKYLENCILNNKGYENIGNIDTLIKEGKLDVRKTVESNVKGVSDVSNNTQNEKLTAVTINKDDNVSVSSNDNTVKSENDLDNTSMEGDE